MPPSDSAGLFGQHSDTFTMDWIEQARKRRQESRDLTVPKSGAARSDRTVLGLTLLELVRKPGATFTRDDIALWAGCTQEAIRRTEVRALMKIRVRLKFGRYARMGAELEGKR